MSLCIVGEDAQGLVQLQLCMLQSAHYIHACTNRKEPYKCLITSEFFLEIKTSEDTS